MNNEAVKRQATTNIESIDRQSGFSWPVFDDDQIAAVEKVLRSGKVNYWTGTEGQSFEREFADYCGSGRAIALANGTVALDLALRTFGITAGDEVVVPSRTFVATASSVVLAGAIPVFADVDRDSGNLTVDSIAKVVTRKTRAVIPVHLGGWPCDMPAILELAKELRLIVIEDCAQAHGAAIGGQRVGSFGDTGAFSFCQDKIMTTGGEGGMLVLSDDARWSEAWSFKDHGKSHAAVFERDHPPGFRWLHESFGTNWRLTEMQSAMGRIQLARLDEWITRRARNAATLAASLAPFSCIRVPMPAAAVRHAYYKFYAYVRPEKLRNGWSRDKIVAAITDLGVPCFSGSCSEIYLERSFLEAGLRPSKRRPVAKELGETSLQFLVHPTLTSDEIDRTRDAIEKVLALACQ